MLCAIKRYVVALICLVGVYFPNVNGQSLQGKVIYVSPTQEVLIKFGKVITNFKFSNKEEEGKLFEWRLVNNKNFTLNSTIDNFKPTNLIISEGGNTHLFILEYKKSLDVRTESIYDFSTKEKLKKETEKIDASSKETAKEESKLPVDPPVIQPSSNGHEEKTPVAGPSENYSDLVIKANKAYSSGNFDEAKQFYTSALVIKPKDTWCVFQIDAIDNKKNAARIKEQQAALDLVYKQHITAGDSAFNKKSYEIARVEYTNALNQKSNDQYASLQLTKIDQALKEESYRSFMAIGMDAMTTHQFDNAGMAFNEALKIKPNDAEARKELAKINQTKAAFLKKQKDENLVAEKQNQFKDTVALADNMFEAGLYEDSKKKYVKAGKMKPDEPHISKKIAEIDAIFLKRKTEKNKIKEDSLNTLSYNKEVAKANKAFESKDYLKAKSSFQMAQRLKPGEKYPAEKISTIDVLLLRQEEEKKAEVARKALEENNTRQYNFAIKQGSSAMKNSDYSTAKKYYLQAMELKPGEKTPIAQLEIINVKLEEIRNEESYHHFVHIADSTAWIAKDYKTALRFYDSASVIKPAATLPKKQIIAINQILLEEQTRLNKQLRRERFDYAFADFKNAESARKEQKYEQAYVSYNEFLVKIDTLSASQYTYAQQSYINQAREYIVRLNNYKPKPKKDPVITPERTPDNKKKNKKKKN